MYVAAPLRGSGSAARGETRMIPCWRISSGCGGRFSVETCPSGVVERVEKVEDDRVTQPAHLFESEENLGLRVPILHFPLWGDRRHRSSISAITSRWSDWYLAIAACHVRITQRLRFGTLNSSRICCSLWVRPPVISARAWSTDSRILGWDSQNGVSWRDSPSFTPSVSMNPS